MKHMDHYPLEQEIARMARKCRRNRYIRCLALVIILTLVGLSCWLTVLKVINGELELRLEQEQYGQGAIMDMADKPETGARE